MKPRCTSTRQIVLLSLFEGIGTAYISLRRMLREAGLLECISSAFFVEISERLAGAVREHWDRVASDGLSCPYHYIAADVWDLLRDDAALACHFARFIPRGCLVLVVGGSPCLQLTKMVDKGKAGLTGLQSFNFFVFPFLLYTLQELRPDTLIHGVIENAGKARPEHTTAIIDALHIHPSQAPKLDSAYFTAAPRLRLIASTLPPIEGPVPYPLRRPSPFEEGWGFRGPGRTPESGDDTAVVKHRSTFLTGRSDNDTTVPPTASTYQCEPRLMLFHSPRGTASPTSRSPPTYAPCSTPALV